MVWSDTIKVDTDNDGNGGFSSGLSDESIGQGEEVVFSDDLTEGSQVIQSGQNDDFQGKNVQKQVDVNNQPEIILGMGDVKKEADYEKDILPKLLKMQRSLVRLSELLKNDNDLQRVVDILEREGYLVINTNKSNKKAYNYVFWMKLEVLLREVVNYDDTNNNYLSQEFKGVSAILSGIKEETKNIIQEEVGEMKEIYQFVYRQFSSYVQRLIYDTRDRYTALTEAEKEIIADKVFTHSIFYFNPRYGVQFATYLASNIYRRMQQVNKRRVINHLTGMVNDSLPKEEHIAVKELGKIYERLTWELRKYPGRLIEIEYNDKNKSIIEVVKRIQKEMPQLSEHVIWLTVKIVLESAVSDISLSYVDAGGQAKSKLDLGLGQVVETPEDKFVDKEIRDMLEKVLKQIAGSDPKRLVILQDRIFSDNRTQEEIAEQFGVSRTRIYQLEKTMLEKAKDIMLKKIKGDLNF